MRYSLFLCIILFVLDRFFKYLAMQYFSKELLSWGSFFVFKFQFFQNPYIAFGIPIYLNLILFVSLIVFFFLGYFVYQNYLLKKYFEVLIFLFVIMGGLSNFWDRIVYGFVIDYFELAFLTFNIPVFNIADIMISIPLVLYIFTILKTKKV